MDTMPPDPDGQQETLPCPADYAATFKFLDFIFDGIVDAFVEFRYFSSGRRPKSIDHPTYLNLPLDHDRIAGDVLSLNGQRMITIGLAPRCRIPAKGRPGRNEDVLQVGCIWANLDYARSRGGAIDVISRIREFPLRPSIVVNSGYGYHVYFVFHTPLCAGDLLVWSELVQELRAAVGVDPRANLNELMRLPGTLNIKEAHPVRCEISDSYSSWVRYSPEEVRKAIQDYSSRATLISPNIPIGSLQQRGVSADVIESIITGRAGIEARAGFNGESGRDIWIASILFEKMFEEEEIKTIFRSHPNGCGSNWARKKDGEKYLKQILQRAALRRMTGEVWQEEGESTPGTELPSGYVLREGAIWFDPSVLDADKKPPKSIQVSSSFIRITKIQENIDTGEISLSIAFDYLDKARHVLILRSEMADSRKLVAALAGAGAPITSNNARLVTAYLAAYEHAFASTIPRQKVTSRFGRGRTGSMFFFPGLNSTIAFAPSSSGDAALYRAYSSRRGSLGGWLEVIHTLADDGLIIPQIAVLASLVPPLQKGLQIPNFILDLYGNSSTGKSTSLKLAASVYGRPHDPDSLVLQWMNTQVAVEQVAGLCSELPIYLDDAQHCSVDLKRSIIYMIANGRGKGRSAQGRGIRETASWHTVALSSSEAPLHESSPHEGARGRILPIGGRTPAIPAGMGSLVRSLERAVIQNHGHAGETYIRHLNGWTEVDWSKWRTRYSGIRSELLRSSSSDLLGRVSGYIAAIQLAAAVSCPLLDLRFNSDVIGAWLMLHLDEQQSNQNLVLVALRELSDFYVANMTHFAGDGSYSRERRVSIYGASKQQKYVGFLRSTIETIFRARKWSPTAVLNKLAEAGAFMQPRMIATRRR
jgi:hypothetical protein